MRFTEPCTIQIEETEYIFENIESMITDIWNLWDQRKVRFIEGPLPKIDMMLVHMYDFIDYKDAKVYVKRYNNTVQSLMNNQQVNEHLKEQINDIKILESEFRQIQRDNNENKSKLLADKALEIYKVGRNQHS